MEVVPIPFDQTLPTGIPLRAGALHGMYGQGGIRQVKAGGLEIAKMLYGAVRDTHWGTLSHQIHDERIVDKGDRFVITYRASYTSDVLDYEAWFRIEGREDSSLCFSMQGKALRDCAVNRIGLCAHLPIGGYRGREVEFVREDGTVNQAVFPRLISPHQVFTDVKGIRMVMGSDVGVEWLFEGEVFEIEDQRNWMDDSYKVYGRPLALPFPYAVKAGECMEQHITLKLSGDFENLQVVHSGDDRVSQKVSVPQIGYAISDVHATPSPQELALLGAVPFDHGLVELAFDADWRQPLDRAIERAGQLDVMLSLALFFSDDYQQEVDVFLLELEKKAAWVKSILPLKQGEKVTPIALLDYAYPRLKAVFPSVQVGYGTDAYFAELNRNRPVGHRFDFISFSMNPQVHVFDTQSILGNVNSIGDMIATVRSFTDKPIHVSPVTFKKRKNHDATQADEQVALDAFDERQYTWFGAGWFLLCLYSLGQAGQVSFFEAIGEQGITGNSKGEQSPLYQILTALKCFNPVLMWKEESPTGMSIVFENTAGDTLAFHLDPQFSLLM